jgi:hypothetical protein
MPACVITASINVNKERLAALDVSSGEETSITGTINYLEGYSMPCYFSDHIWETYGMESHHLRFGTYNWSPCN